MAITVTLERDPGVVLERAREFLASEPVAHNLILTLLHARVSHPEDGRYWIASRGDKVAGVVFQSPLDFPVTVTPLADDIVGAVVAAIAGAGIAGAGIAGVGIVVPGVTGQAGVAARFAGEWTELTKSPATPTDGQRLYELDELMIPPAPGGALRLATRDDRDVLVDWLTRFQAEAGEGPATDVAVVVDRRSAAGQLWLWDDKEPQSLAAVSTAVEGVARIGPVFTPEDARGRGYAAGCVAAAAANVVAAGNRCILSADLANPISNLVYRRLGFRAVAEVLRYRFG